MGILGDIKNGVKDVPLWGWGAIGVGGILLLRHKASSPTTQDVSAGTGSPVVLSGAGQGSVAGDSTAAMLAQEFAAINNYQEQSTTLLQAILAGQAGLQLGGGTGGTGGPPSGTGGGTGGDGGVMTGGGNIHPIFAGGGVLNPPSDFPTLPGGYYPPPSGSNPADTGQIVLQPGHDAGGNPYGAGWQQTLGGTTWQLTGAAGSPNESAPPGTPLTPSQIAQLGPGWSNLPSYYGAPVWGGLGAPPGAFSPSYNQQVGPHPMGNIVNALQNDPNLNFPSTPEASAVNMTPALQSFAQTALNNPSVPMQDPNTWNLSPGVQGLANSLLNNPQQPVPVIDMSKAGPAQDTLHPVNPKVINWFS